MNKKLVKNLVTIAAEIAAVISIIALVDYTERLKEENERLQANQERLAEDNNVITAECRKYRTADSLSAYKVAELRLRLDEYRRYREEDMETIRKLKIDRTGLQKVIESQTSAIYELNARLRDSVAVSPEKPGEVSFKTFDYRSEWVDVSGRINTERDEVHLEIRNREELTVVETVKYKRFLGFLWKTRRIKGREVDVLSRNPHTEIVGVDYVNIEK